MHIAHQYDREEEPWPIEIEDHDGKLHTVSLAAGEMLFYESAKCLHGRMTEFKGKYYGSIFLHYQPVDKQLWPFTVQDVIESVPPHWNRGLLEEVGSRWAGQAITTDDRVAVGAPPRVVKNRRAYEEYLSQVESEEYPTYGSGAPGDGEASPSEYEMVHEEDEITAEEMSANEVSRRNRLLEMRRPISRTSGKIPRIHTHTHTAQTKNGLQSDEL